MKKIYSVLIVLLLMLTACSPKHTVAVNVVMEDDFSGTLEINMSMKAEDLVIESPSEGETQATLEEVQTVVTTILSETDRFNKDLVKSEIKDNVLYFTYAEPFDSLEGFEAIVSKALDKEYKVDTYSSGSLLSGKTIVSGLYFNTDALLSWIYDEIETRKSFGDNSSRPRTYLTDASKLVIDGKEMSRWGNVEIENNPQLESIYYDIYLKDDSNFDSTVTITAKASELSGDDAKQIVSQFEKESKDVRLSETQTIDTKVIEEGDLVTIEVKTENITGSKYEDLMYTLIDADVSLEYKTNDDNTKATLQTSLYKSFSSVAKNTDKMDLRVHLNNYVIKAVDDVNYDKKPHDDFDIEADVITNIENSTEFMLELNKPINFILIGAAALAGLLAVILAFFGIKKVSASNKAKKDNKSTETKVETDAPQASEVDSDVDVVEEVLIVEAGDEEVIVVEDVITTTEASTADAVDSTEAERDVKNLKQTESSITSKVESVDVEDLVGVLPTEDELKSNANKTAFMDKLMESFKDANTYIKAAIFIALSLVFGFLIVLISGDVMSEATDILSSSAFMGQLMVGLGLSSGAGVKIVADARFSTEVMVFDIPVLIALIGAYWGTLFISTKVLHTEKTDGMMAFAQNIAMSAVVIVALLVFSFIPVSVADVLKLSLGQSGIFLRALPMHLIMAFICAYKLNFSEWPLPINKDMMAYIAQRMFFILGLSSIAMIYILIEAGFGALPFIFNIYAISGFLAMGGSVHLGSSLFSLDMGPLMTYQFNIWLVLLMIVGAGIMVFNVDDLFKKTEEKDPIKFTLTFSGIVVVIYTVLASLSSIKLNMGTSDFLGSASLGISYTSVLIAFALIAILTYVRITLLSGVDLKAKVGEASKTLVVSAKNASASIAAGAKEATSKTSTDESSDTEAIASPKEHPSEIADDLDEVPSEVVEEDVEIVEVVEENVEVVDSIDSDISSTHESEDDVA